MTLFKTSKMPSTSCCRMKTKDFVSNATSQLHQAGISTARLDCLVLLEDVLNTNRTQVIAHPEREITEVEFIQLNDMVTKRAQHIPLAYIRGKTEFYGREFIIDNHVLEPRPESETMIELLLKLPSNSCITIIDVGTGSGALAITANLELPRSRVIAVDIDNACLAVTRANANKFNTAITIQRGDLLQNIPTFEGDATLLCNLPYVPDNFQINTAATHEPRLAIFGGKDGLDLFRRLFDQLQGMPNVKNVLCESLPPQHDALAAIAADAGFAIADEQDFIQLFSR